MCQTVPYTLSMLLCLRCSLLLPYLTFLSSRTMASSWCASRRSSELGHARRESCREDEIDRREGRREDESCWTGKAKRRACAQAVVAHSVARSCEQAGTSDRARERARASSWIASLLTFGRCAFSYSPTVTVQSVDAILLFLGEPGDVPADEEVQKRGIQCYATAYPVLFRHA